MTGRVWFAACLAGALVSMGCAWGGGSEAPAARPAVTASETRTASATVEEIDLPKRLVTLRGDDGGSFVVHAPEEVRNLAQVRPGDRVTATYHELVSIRVLAPGTATPGVGSTSSSGHAEPGEKPAGTATEELTVTSTVEKVDRAAQQVTLRLPDGRTEVVNVRNPENLAGVAAGDLVEMSYLRAVSIVVEAPAD